MNERTLEQYLDTNPPSIRSRDSVERSGRIQFLVAGMHRNQVLEHSSLFHIISKFLSIMGVLRTWREDQAGGTTTSPRMA